MADDTTLNPSSRWRRWLRACALGATAWMALSGAVHAAEKVPAPLAGPAAGPVDANYFGLVLNRNEPGAPWPDVPFGSWRIWDAYVTWPYLEPQKGHWEWTALDRMVDEAGQHHVDPLLVLAHSPKWASARPSESSGYKPGFAAEPKSIDDWREYVRTVATRYKGRIHEYQIWNEPSDKAHFTGTVDQLVQLVCSAHDELKKVDPSILVVGPGSAGVGKHLDYMDEFLSKGGAKCIDVFAYHFYVPRFGPEEMVSLVRQVRGVMHKHGLDAMPLWNTESGWWIANTDGTPEPDAVAKGGWRKLDADVEAGGVIERAFLLMRAEGVQRFYWYAWANKYGWGLTDQNGKPKPATRYWTQVHDEMIGRTVGPCTLQADGGSCQLSAKDGSPARTVRWSDPTAFERRDGPADKPAQAATIPK